MDTVTGEPGDRSAGVEGASSAQAELLLLQDIAHALAGAGDLQAFLSRALAGCRQVFACERAALLKLTPDGSLLTLVQVEPESAHPLRHGRRFGRAGTQADAALRKGITLVEVPEGAVGSDRVLRALAGEQAGRSAALLPLHAGGEDRGVLVLLNARHGFRPASQGVWRAIAHQIGVGLQRAELLQGRASAAERLKAFNTALKVTGSALEEGTLLAHAVEALLSVCPADRVELVKARREGSHLVYGHGVPADVRRAREAGRLDGSLHASAMRRGEPVVRAAGDWPTLAASDDVAGDHAVVVPLTVRGQTAGTLLLARASPPFEQQEIELLTAFGRQLGLAAEHARLLGEQHAGKAGSGVDAGTGTGVGAAATGAVRLVRQAGGRSTETQRARSRWLKALGELAAGVAHDLNNALNPIVAYAELVRSRATQPDLVREYTERILLAAHDGAETVRRIQRFTRRPAEESAHPPVGLAHVVKEAVELTRPAWAERTAGGPIEIVQAVESELLVAVSPAELRQSLLNLISNALDAMPTGGELRFIGRSEGEDVLLAVQDTGAGMPADVLERALEPFFTTKGTRGTGLGLSEVYGITRRQGGRLELQSWSGVGTTVLLRLPAESRAARGPSVASPVPAAVQASRILVVDDNVLGLEALAAALRNAGHAVVTASSGEAALRVFEPRRFSVVLTDLGMPDLSGWELLDQLRARDTDVRLGVITGWAMERGDRELRERGIDLVFLKPVNVDELLAAL